MRDASNGGTESWIARTPWRLRLIVWPGEPFRTLPFPYLLNRWDVYDTGNGWLGGYFTKRGANRQLAMWRESKAEVG